MEGGGGVRLSSLSNGTTDSSPEPSDSCYPEGRGQGRALSRADLVAAGFEQRARSTVRTKRHRARRESAAAWHREGEGRVEQGASFFFLR